MDKTNYIHRSRLIDLMLVKQPNGAPKEFSFRFCKRSTGQLVTWNRVVLTSFHAKGGTINIKLCNSEEIKTIRLCLITRFNNLTVYI